MNTPPLFQANPFLSQWLSMANAAAGAWRGFWTAEMARQQAQMMTDFNRQVLAFWTGALAQRPTLSAGGPASGSSAPAPSAPVLKLVEPFAPEPKPPVPEVLAAPPAAPAAETPLPVPAAPVEVKLAKPKKPAQQLRAARPVRKAAPRRGGSKATRH